MVNKNQIPKAKMIKQIIKFFPAKIIKITIYYNRSNYKNKVNNWYRYSNNKIT
jgi:hypothetical protein